MTIARAWRGLPDNARATLWITIGALTTAAMVCFVRGFAAGESSVVGAAIIVASTLYVARRESMAGRRSPVG